MTTTVELERRVAALERDRFRETHEHLWRYTKHVTVYPKGAFHPGRHIFWEWRCVDEQCDYGSGGTNHRGGLPTHFPDDLR